MKSSGQRNDGQHDDRESKAEGDPEPGRGFFGASSPVRGEAERKAKSGHPGRRAKMKAGRN